ncbi:MAG: MgtC/SapB family protein [Lachnospiraceae bacterium]
MINEITRFFSSFEGIAFIRILLSLVCGGIVGFEREVKGRPAGLKTFSLVCLGATLAMVTNEYIYTYIAQSTGDSARMAAQVISGIGFLGAGTIIVTGNSQVKGLTTAAALWVTAAIGIAIGTGFYFGGIVGVVVIFISSKVFNAIDQMIMENSAQMKLLIEGESEEFLVEVLDYINKNELTVQSFERTNRNKWFSEDVCVLVSLEFAKKKKHKIIKKDIKQMKGIRSVTEI